MRWATFDCYGTLIDWHTGIWSALAQLWPDADTEGLLLRYHEAEPEVERENPTYSYRAVLARCLRLVADGAGIPLPPEAEGALGDSLPGWPVFPEVPGALSELKARGWRLAILSNTDSDLIAASIAQIGVPVEEVVVASEIGSYKPALRHWQVFFERTGASREEHVHVAASLFHDIAPASKLGLKTVWINRLAEKPGPVRSRELSDLGRLADVLEELVS